MELDHASLRPAQVADVYRLIHEVCELGSDAYSWRSRLLARVRQLVDADSSTAYVMGFALDPGQVAPNLMLMMYQNLDESWSSYLQANDLTTNPFTPAIMKRFGTDFTVVRQDLISDEAWYGDAFWKQVAEPAGWDQAILSQVAIPGPKIVDGLGFTRRPGREPFEPYQVALVKLIHTELARLWRRPDPIGVHTLPPRQREVLEGIRRGLARKEIAAGMGVSERTVHSYEKSLFESDTVRSRGELLARLATRVQPNLLP